MPDQNDDLDDGEVLQAGDTLDDRGLADALDEGWSPPERPWGVDDFGVTAREEAEGERLAARLARELPEDVRRYGDGLGDSSDTDGELLDGEVGSARAGRLVATDQGWVVDADEELYAVDVGVDGAGASAEEAAVHVVDEEYDLDEDRDEDRDTPSTRS